MRKLFRLVLILSFSALFLTGCGSSNSTTPVQKTQTSTFVFMQGVSGQTQIYSPMIGKFAMTGGSTVFSSAAIVDSSTGTAVTGDFYSIIMSADGKKAAVDLFGGLDRNSGQWDIWVANIDGSNMVQITNDVNGNRAPQFSPDGSKVVFVSNRPTGTDIVSSYQVVTRNIDGSSEQVIPLPTGFQGSWAPTFSPDGSKIAMEMWGYDASSNWYDGIWVMNVDGSNAAMLTNPAVDCNCHDQTPSFSSDGTKIAFSRQDWNTYQEDIYVMNADGSGATNLTQSVGNNFAPFMINIAGVGQRILFSSNRDNLSPTDGTGYELYSITVDGNQLTRLTNNNLYDSFNSSFDASGGSSAAERRH